MIPISCFVSLQGVGLCAVQGKVICNLQFEEAYLNLMESAFGSLSG